MRLFIVLMFISASVSAQSPCKVDSLKAVIKTLNSKLFVANYKIERVRYYLKITMKKPSQTKFLKSWISRAIQN